MQSERRTSSARSLDAPAPGQRRSIGQWFKDVLLFFASPFLSIAYAAALPVVGLKRAMQARQAKGTNPPGGAAR